MDIQISRDYMALMYYILYCNKLCPTATSIQIIERRQDVPYISVFNTMVLLQHFSYSILIVQIVNILRYKILSNWEMKLTKRIYEFANLQIFYLQILNYN